MSKEGLDISFHVGTSNLHKFVLLLGQYVDLNITKGLSTMATRVHAIKFQSDTVQSGMIAQMVNLVNFFQFTIFPWII